MHSGSFGRADSHSGGLALSAVLHPFIVVFHEQKLLLDYWIERAAGGSAVASGLLTFSPCKFWPYLRNRTLWLIGDSITQEFMHAMECFFVEFWDLTRLPISSNENLIDRVKEAGKVDPWCIHLPGKARICHIRCNNGHDLAVHILPNARSLSSSADIWLLNFAVWLNKAEDYTSHLQAFKEYYERNEQDMPFIIWRDGSPQHFPKSATGDFESWGPDHFPCKPLDVSLDSKDHLHTQDAALQILTEGGWRNKLAAPVMDSLGIPVLATWNQSVPLWQWHHHYNPHWAHQGYGNGECTHSCHPSVYQLWVYQLYALLDSWH
ncbi:hypothetical protein WJX84_008112 [Apatococcus fuscideae]|uniref:Uncharacterized protein n=1 Tax=Apatococcus fuscideae TaxID=2026836 RepID=A0AAW1TFM7_9CHLO